MNKKGFQFGYEFSAPDAWEELSKADPLAELLEDLYQLGNKFFIKGNLWIPIEGASEQFNLTTWVSLNMSDYNRSIELWDTAGRELEPPYPGKLANEIPLYLNSLGLPVQIITMGVGERPSIILEPADHPLVTDQRNGIPLQKVIDLAETLNS